MNKRTSSGSKLLWILIIVGFALMEFPGIYFFNRVEPMLFNLPFIYGINIIFWAYMCTLLFIGYKTQWGRGKDYGDTLNEEKE